MTVLDKLWNYIKWFYETKIHFLQLHYFYIFIITFITSTFFYYQPGTQWNYIDALFMATSAATNTGLNTIPMSQLSTWQMLAVYFSSFLGSHIVISIIILYVRKHYFSKRFEDILIFNRAQRLREENRRRFEKNLQDMDKQQNRRSLGSFEKIKQYPLRRRLSFISVRSSTNQKDIEDNQTTVPISHPKKKNRSDSQPPLSASFSHFDLLSHFRRKSQHFDEDDDDSEKVAEAREDEIVEEKTPAPLDTDYIENVMDSNITAVNPSRSNSDGGNRKEEEEENVNFSDFYRDNSEASHVIRPSNINNNNNNNTLSTSTTTIPLIYQNGNENTNTSPTNNISLCLINPTETILSSHDQNSNNDNNNNSVLYNNNKNSMSVHFDMDEKNTDAPNKSTSTLAEENNNNTVSGTQQGIAFAENIERQREIARRRLEQDRRFEDILQRIAGDSTSTTPTFDNHHNQHMDPESDDEEMKRIMREPIHKSELTRQQRYRLGGAEYRAIVFLTRLVPFYYLFCSLGFGLIIRIYIAFSTYAQEVLKTTNTAGPLNEWLFSFFCSMSSFNNLGLSLMDASMVPFQSSPGLLIPIMFLILAGNTAYAIILRLIIWILYKCTPKSYVMRKETFRYLLDHPRRCYTTLFPSTQTKWLLIVLIGITAVEFVSFVALNFWLPVLEGMDWGARILGGLFQSVATRCGKF